MLGRVLLAFSALLATAFADGPSGDICDIENGFDYVGQDITSVQGDVNDCCKHCFKTPNCTAWSWTAPHSGTCYLKYGADNIQVNVNVKSARYVQSLEGLNACHFYQDVDFVGNDIGNVPNKPHFAECCQICRDTLGCRAYSWSDFNNGTCWLKATRDRAVFKAGVKSADAYENGGITFKPVFAMEQGIDYVDNDIGSTLAKDPYDCGKLCYQRFVAGCRAYAWNDVNGGTCWFKSKKDKTTVDTGVTSGYIVSSQRP